MLPFFRLSKPGCSSRLPLHLHQAVRHYARPIDTAAPAETPDNEILSIAPPGGLVNSEFPKSPSSLKELVPAGPKYSILVKKDHGLYGFFRKKEDSTGQVTYETIEGPDEHVLVPSGRAWRASELRLKSFQDLHVLWYVVLRERNLLATQGEEGRRMGIQNPEARSSAKKATMCRKTMARIKYVLNERRLAYEGACELVEREAEERKAQKEDLQVHAHNLREWRRARRLRRAKGTIAAPDRLTAVDDLGEEGATDSQTASGQPGESVNDFAASETTPSQPEAELTGATPISDSQLRLETREESKAKKRKTNDSPVVEETPEGIEAAESSLFGSSSSSARK